jgi:linoleate 10R-lipoxygenase
MLVAFNFTSWGYQDCQYDISDGSYGGMLTKLLFRTLPDHYPAGSAYAHFPFLVPEKMKKWVDKSSVGKYTWTRPVVPQALARVDTYHEVAHVLNDGAKFVSEYNNRLLVITKGIKLNRVAVSTFQVSLNMR